MHDPKGKTKTIGKVSTKLSKHKLSKPHWRSNKCSADSEEEEDKNEDKLSIDESKPQAKKKGTKCWQQGTDLDLENDVETIDIDVGPPVKEAEGINMEGDGNEPCPDEEVRANYNILQPLLTFAKFQDDGLNKHQHGEEVEEKPTKKELMCDILKVISDKVTVKINIAMDKFIIEWG